MKKLTKGNEIKHYKTEVLAYLKEYCAENSTQLDNKNEDKKVITMATTRKERNYGRKNREVGAEVVGVG